MFNPAKNETPVEGNHDEPYMNSATVKRLASAVELMTRYPGHFTRCARADPGPVFKYSP